MYQQGSGDYCVDIVMCIDATSSMAPILNEVKENALTFYQRFEEAMDENEKTVDTLRVKVIVFRDYMCDSEPMTESPFFTLPAQAPAFKRFVQEIEAEGGGDTPESGLEALALALKSDWTTGGNKRRHAVLVFSDAPALPLGKRAGCHAYPSGMPRDLAELGSWWEGTDQRLMSKYQPKSGRLVVFAPEVYPWKDIQAWNRYWPAFSPAGKGLADVDMAAAIDLLVGSF